MASYIGKVQIGETGEQVSVGSTLYGVCGADISANTASKVVVLPDFDTLMNGITVQVRFVNGNLVTSNVTLQVGTTNAYPVQGNCVCAADDVIAFTFAQDGNNSYWYAHHSILVQEGTTNGTIKIAGQEATVHGLGSAAYQNTNAFATAAQGTLAENAMPKSGGTFTGPVILDGNPTAAMGAATKSYVDNIAQGLEDLTAPMHFIGDTPVQDGEGHPILPDAQTSYENYAAGDVLLVGTKEYVYSKGNNAASSYWILLGDEGSYALKSSTASVGSSSGWDPGALPQLGDAITADDITNWDAGTASNATVSQGVLRLVNSTVPSLTHEARSIPNITNLGTLPTLTVTPTTVVVPDNSATP